MKYETIEKLARHLHDRNETMKADFLSEARKILELVENDVRKDFAGRIHKVLDKVLDKHWPNDSEKVDRLFREVRKVLNDALGLFKPPPFAKIATPVAFERNAHSVHRPVDIYNLISDPIPGTWWHGRKFGKSFVILDCPKCSGRFEIMFDYVAGSQDGIIRITMSCPHCSVSFPSIRLIGFTDQDAVDISGRCKDAFEVLSKMDQPKEEP